MGLALVGGLVSSGWATEADLAVIEASASQRDVIAASFPGVTVSSTPLAGVDAVLAVKPWAIVEVAAALESPGRLLSVAAGIPLAAIEAVVPAGTPVIRSMPNTPALVAAGAAGVAPGVAAQPADVDWAVGLLGAVGVAEVVTEAQLDAVTGLSGSGPAYLFLVAEALTDAGVREGLSRTVAERLAHQTIYGAGKMLVETGESAVELRASVTTPGGTTAAGLAALERHAVRAAFADAVGLAAARSVELGRPAGTA